jgi:hypothetical protein
MQIPKIPREDPDFLPAASSLNVHIADIEQSIGRRICGVPPHTNSLANNLTARIKAYTSGVTKWTV